MLEIQGYQDLSQANAFPIITLLSFLAPTILPFEKKAFTFHHLMSLLKCFEEDSGVLEGNQ